MGIEVVPDSYEDIRNLRLVVNGENSDMIIIEKTKGKHEISIYPKRTDEKDIRKVVFGTDIIKTEFSDYGIISLYCYENVDDYYIALGTSKKVNISDICGSYFFCVEDSAQGTDVVFYTYYAYIEGYNEEYELYVEDTVIYI